MNEEEEKQLLSQAMSLLAKRKSEARAKASRENGKRGGRPPKSKTEEAPDPSEAP